MVRWNFLWCAIVTTFICLNADIQTCRFKHNQICTAKIVPPQNVYQQFYVRSLTECLQHCRTQTACLSVNYGEPECQLTNATLDAYCKPSIDYPGWKNYESCHSPCKNGGYLVNNTCWCNGGFYGAQCEQIVTDCTHASSIPFYQNQRPLILVKPALASQPFYVICEDRYGAPRTYVQIHITNQTNFNRSWEEYKWGFGDMFATSSNDFWLGNEQMHLLTNSRNFKLVIEMDSADWGLVYKAIYTQFQIYSEASEYRLNYNMYQPPTESLSGGALGDSLYHNKDQIFSTYDHDNTNGCPAHFNSGWWFNTVDNCTYANPNGILTTSPTRLGIDAEAYWTFDRHDWSPKIVQIWLEAA
ncbi:hypothetical protein CHS0354_022068 [Potamilus streckersoni]|uniref:Fibrinogen C-terminal domain-containing protein n=1 Tax=Potamilus streckersoni TaxID=2493646 RepID=A0AAE0SSQ7_9BIVA|nr:hypothetical protein CHS0354_022068 [Potamilus streckersoni]